MRNIMFVLVVFAVSCRPCKEVIKTDTICKTVLQIDTLKIDDENILKELDRCYVSQDSLRNIHCPEPLINVSGGKLKIKNNKGLQIMMVYKSTIDSLKAVNARIFKEKNDVYDSNKQLTESYKKSLMKLASTQCDECSWWDHILLLFYGFIAGGLSLIAVIVGFKIKKI